MIKLQKSSRQTKIKKRQIKTHFYNLLVTSLHTELICNYSVVIALSIIYHRSQPFPITTNRSIISFMTLLPQ